MAAGGVSQVTWMGYVFQDATAFNQPIGDWDVSKVGNMDAMFNPTTYARAAAYAFNQPIGGRDVTSLTFVVHVLFQLKFQP